MHAGLRHLSCTHGLGMRTGCRHRFLSAAVLFAASLHGACGSTTPVSPSPPSGPPSIYPVLIGDRSQWKEDGSGLVLQFRDTGTTLPYKCETTLNIQTQSEGFLTGSFELQGVSQDSGKQCTYFSRFTAQITSDGTISSFRPEQSFVTSSCTPVSDATFSGTATSTGIHIKMTDRAACQDSSGRSRDTDRTLNMWVTRR
jgi:hypothetical protein